MHPEIVLCWLSCIWAITKGYQKENKFTNLWIAEIHGGEAVAERVSRDLGFIYKGQASHFKNHYELVRDDQPELSDHHSDHFTRDLLDFDEVKWAKQQVVVERRVGPYDYNKWEHNYEEAQEKKLMDFLWTAKKTGTSRKTESCSSFFSCLNFPAAIMNFLTSIGDGSVQNLGKFTTEPFDESFLDKKGVTKNPGQKSRKVSAYAVRFNDPNWRKQWYVHDYRTSDMPVMDHNVVPVYKMGFTGMNVKVAILDDGVQHDHPDLKGNFDESLSYDVCKDIPGSMPKKIYGKWASDYHGTSCAGVIAMVPDNKICGVGIAYRATVAGIRMMGDRATEYIEAKALSHTINKFDIYSSSWTPPDKGYTMWTLDHMAKEAYIKGTTEGRDGKGVIYLQSTGNGREFGNNCAANCFINHPYAIGIGSANQLGKRSRYSERCAAVFATAYSGSRGSEGVTTLNGDIGCNPYFSGSSAAVPIAAGIIALVLESKPQLTYRDVMHLIAMTAEVAPLANNEHTWHRNGRGIWVSNAFGFGLMNALNMVKTAKNWVNVPPKRTCIVSITLDKPMQFKLDKPATIPFETDACSSSESDAINYLEHLEVTADLTFRTRGAIVVVLQSPSGLVTALLESRPKDVSTLGLDGWNIMSLRNWGEDPKGKWMIQVSAEEHIYSRSDDKGEVRGFTFTFHGTAEKPYHYNKPRKYAAFRLPDGKTSKPTNT